MLNSDQQQALEQILRWYRGNKLNLILSGRGGRRQKLPPKLRT
jgi:hypothetical protein